MKYEIILYWSNEDSAYIAETPEEALKNIQIVAAEWIETAKELNRPIPKPRGHRLQQYA